MDCKFNFKLDSIISFLSSYNDLINSQVTGAYVNNYFTCIPESWFQELNIFPYDEIMQLLKILSKVTITQLNNSGLKSFLQTAFTLGPNYPEYTQSINIRFYEALGMSPKKIHEVSRMASFIITKCEELNIHKVIDIGAGQGYLSHLLVTAGNLNVVAVECKDLNIHEANKRGQKISKYYPSTGEFTAISMYVTDQNLQELCNEPCMLVGLHTCGNLASSCLRSFVRNENIRAIVNVGCCFGNLHEFIHPNAAESTQQYLAGLGVSFKGRSLDDTLWKSEEEAGYPLSNYIKTQHSHFFLGRMARVLAMSEFVRNHLDDPQQMFEKFSYRAAFQVLLKESYPHLANVYNLGRKIKDYTTWGEYSLICLTKMKLSTSYTLQDLNDMYDTRFKHLEKQAAVLWSLRCMLSFPIENLIYLDRVIYLKEHGCNPQIVQIFDKYISPRNHLIYAYKDYKDT